MNPEHFQLQENTFLDSHFELESDLISPHFFETYADELKAYGIFTVGMIALFGSGFYAIDNFNPAGQAIGWTGVIASSGVAFYGANLISKLEPDMNDETIHIL